MAEKNNINQVEKLTGVSKRNIRFYEKEGLLLPKRDSGNGYRVYDESDIWRIKVIKMLRMVDMPLDEIKNVLEEEITLGMALLNQQSILEQRAKELQTAISFCKKMEGENLKTLNVDACLYNMEEGEGFFKGWVEDYKRIVKENLDMDFSFIPDIAITNAREFTEALFIYATQEKLDLVVTKESMYPEFTINGIAYVAERNYGVASGVPLAIVTCHRKDREIKGEGIKESRKNLQWFLHNWGWTLAIAIAGVFFEIPYYLQGKFSWETALIFIGLSATYGIMSYRQKLLHFNDKTKW